MKKFRGVMIGLFLAALCQPVVFGEIGWKASGRRGAVAAGGAEAVEAGMEILKKGGNAADAAAATLLALTVCDGQSFCFGGEVPILIYDAKRKTVIVIAGQGAAPQMATLDYFKKRGYGTIPGSGVVPATVPAALGAIVTALDRCGTLTFSAIAAPTLKILSKRDKQWHKDFAKTLRRLIEAEGKAGGDRRRGLRLVSDYFYRGPIAREIAEWCKANGGLLRFTDMARHVTRVEEPVKISYRGYEVYKCGPWTQGPYLLETLRLLEPFDLKAMGHNSPDYVHAVTEALKLGLADRDKYYADPLFVDVPVEALISKRYADLRRPLIDMKKASLEVRPGDPRKMAAIFGKPTDPGDGAKGPVKDTTTCIVVDRWGNMVAATPSGWSGRVAGRTGVTLGTRLQSLNLWRGHPNCVEPGKRPRITLTPTIVLKDGKAVTGISIAGGDLQDQITLQLMLGKIEFGIDAASSVSAPRFSTDHLTGSFRQPSPKLGSLKVYRALPKETLDELRKRGHRVKIVGEAGNPSMITVDPKTGRIEAVGDPDAGRHADAF